MASVSMLALCGVFVSAAPSSPTGAQSQSDPAKPAPQTQPPPAAASPAPPSATKTTAGKDESGVTNPATNKKKPKKVWTDEEISSVGGKISIVGEQNSSNRSYRAPDSPRSRESQEATSYRQRLAPLRRQIDDLDREIQEMKNAKGSVRENIESQVQIREDKRKWIQAQINEIEEEARRRGIPPGDLR